MTEAMAAISPELAHLRAKIDAIDERMHELLIERAEIVGQVAASKRGGAVGFYQPGREAEILRRLAARHCGALPVAGVLRIWREILAATVRLETPFAVAVFAPPEAQGFWDLARDHYGSHTPISAYGSTGQVTGAVTEGAAAVGILPLPEEGDTDPWWRHLTSQRDDAPRVIARLPFGPRGNARNDGANAFVIGRTVHQETGSDRTLFTIESAADTSRARFLGLLSRAGLDCTFFASWEHAESALNLVEIDGFVPLSDPRIARFYAELGATRHRLLPFGGYAVPLAINPALTEAAKG